MEDCLSHQTLLTLNDVMLLFRFLIGDIFEICHMSVLDCLKYILIPCGGCKINQDELGSTLWYSLGTKVKQW